MNLNLRFLPQGGQSSRQKVSDRDVALEGRAMRPRQFETQSPEHSLAESLNLLCTSQSDSI